ncbi:MAG: DEAD/DEAH box helicase, partial [Cyanobacteria bacterium HKST-UBA04]|nr:DEAD/DEAH box helicase [Cyanobacteria bacterium HKST-UBA04]
MDSQSLFEAYPYTVVSLDYIKAERRRDTFARACPQFIIVDEAHACVGTHRGRQQRYELLKRLADEPERHMLLLTATPHSGDETAFERLLALLNDGFSPAAFESEAYRKRLARHFVQRRRIDVTSTNWGEDNVFPEHKTTEFSYKLNAKHLAFHEAILEYCLGVVQGAGTSEQNRRIAFWGTLALMRCAGSSPAAALRTLRNRLADEPERLEEQVYDEDGEEMDAFDVEPGTGFEDRPQLEALIKQAEALVADKDPILSAVVDLLKPLLEEGANPVVFCRFLATADHVAQGLRQAFQRSFPNLKVEVVTGELTADDRRQRVEEMAADEHRLLVATDCLSEGINLQELFDTVVHYDLSWNPTRHQQREGRVNRFGQPADTVRSILLFSEDSAIDGAVLEVILRKAEAIKAATGVTVPLPEERGAVTSALMNAVILRNRKPAQLTLDLNLAAASKELDAMWKDAEEGERRSTTIFAQNALKPEEVLPEWHKWREILGAPEQLERFVYRAMNRLDAPLESKNGVVHAYLDYLPQAIKERLDGRNLNGPLRITFDKNRVAPHTEIMTRNHALPSILAESLLEGALDPQGSVLEPLGRMGAWPTQGVAQLTTLVLLRLRYKLHVHARKARLLLVEEADTLAFEGLSETFCKAGEAARQLLDLESTGDLPEAAKQRFLAQARQRVEQNLTGAIQAYAQQRAEQLQADHLRVRETKVEVSKVTVEPVLPADIVGLFVLAP